MKIFLYPYYFFRSVLLRGLSNTVHLIRSESVYEKKFGLNTSAFKKSESKEFFHYQGAGYPVLLRIFKEVFPRTKNFSFIDIGSGKGRVLFVAEFYGYNDLTGIEIDAQLIEEAEANLVAYPFKRPDSAFQFINSNALDYHYENKPAIYFLFNPFNERVLDKVLGKVLQSTKSETWFVYMNPMYRKPFHEKNIPVVKAIKTGRYLEAVIYRISGNE